MWNEKDTANFQILKVIFAKNIIQKKTHIYQTYYFRITQLLISHEQSITSLAFTFP